jgi:hypothetical protein
MSPSLFHLVYAEACYAARAQAGRRAEATTHDRRVRVRPRAPFRPRTVR